MVAFAIVAVAMIAGLYFDDPVAEREFPLVAILVIPAVYVFASFFTGGAHGVDLPMYQQAAAVFVIALLMWWVALEACRRVLRFARRGGHGPRVR